MKYHRAYHNRKVHKDKGKVQQILHKNKIYKKHKLNQKNKKNKWNQKSNKWNQNPKTEQSRYSTHILLIKRYQIKS